MIARDTVTGAPVGHIVALRPRYSEAPDWRGATVVIIASGPSLTADDCGRVWTWREEDRRNRKAIVINTSFRLAPWADILYAGDARWWRMYFEEAALVFAGQFWTQSDDANFSHPRLRVIRAKRCDGLALERNLISINGVSGYQSIGLAYQTGAAKIVLLGFDAQSNGKTHWHGDHPPGLHGGLDFKRWRKAFERLARDLEAEGVHVVNASPGTALECFPRTSLDEALL